MNNVFKEEEHNEDILASYIRDACNSPLLKKEEEERLAKLVRKWLDNPRAGEGVRKVGKEAKEKLILSNLKLVVKIAKDYRNLGLDFIDLISEGNLGLMCGVDKYYPSKGAKLSYYASFWIKQYIRRAISNKGRNVRLPITTIDAKLKVLNFIDKFEMDNSRLPTNKEISYGLKMHISRVNKLSEVNFQSRSLNERVLHGDGREEFGNLLEDKTKKTPLEEIIISDEASILNAFLEKLNDKQKYIIQHRFGLGGAKPRTLEYIGKKFSLTRERIRQIEAAALKSLKEMYRKIDKKNIRE